jgi:ATP-binding cassette subfamily F protein 3
LEAALRQYTGTLALITHDRHLIRGIATRICDVRDRGATLYDGDYDYYLYKRELLEEGGAPPPSVTRGSAASASGSEALTPATNHPPRSRKTREERREEAELRNRRYRGTRDARRRLEAVESELETVEERHAELLETLADGDLYRDKERFESAMGEYASLKRRLSELESEWVALSELIEASASEGP